MGGNLQPELIFLLALTLSLSPATRIAGTEAFTFNVTGTNFTPDAIVQWNGTGQPTTVNSSTSLTVSVPASLNVVGVNNVVEVNPHVSHTDPPATFTIYPTFTFALSPSTVAGGTNATGTVTLSGPTPANMNMRFTSDNAVASVPATVTIASGASSGTATISTTSVSSSTPVNITAKNSNITLTQTLTVNPAGTPPNAPDDLAAYATGSGKISLYWTRVSGATGYNIYRSTTQGNELYSQPPVNGSTPVNTPSYSGSSMDIYTDTNLTNGDEYFYTVEAVNSNGSSLPSNEDSDIASASAIPWSSSNPADTLNAIRAQTQNDPEAANFGPLRIAGPDGRIYEDGQTQVEPPDGVQIGSTSQYRMADGSVITVPLPENYMPPTQSVLLNASNGPYRKVGTVKSFKGTQGIFDLPDDAEINKGDAGDDIYLLLGGSGSQKSNEVDGGMQWSQSTVAPFTKNGWNPFMLSYANGTHNAHAIINVPTSPRFPSGSEVTATYLPRTINSYTDLGKFVSLITLHADFTNDDGDEQVINRTYGVVSVYAPNELSSSKRTHSIAQTKPALSKTNSFVLNVGWRGGMVRASNGTWTPWTGGIVPNDQEGSYPLNKSIVDWYTPSPYQTETVYKIDLR